MVTNLRVGIIGYGFVGRFFHAALISATPGLTLAAIASSQPDKVHRDYPEVEVVTPEALIARRDLDLVVIASRPTRSPVTFRPETGKSRLGSRPRSARILERPG